ncbi:MAG: (2Fe-2S) ferredoxin domain-containing protein [Acutalibacteraceae bacterium]|nr:(2Fe-2S) ferredoxin domain-containing protein [Acutalibacteraceae bacterium]
MMKVYVCVGSSCHLRGSYDIINLMKERLEENGLADKVELSAAFCLGKCTEGVSVKVDDEIICGVSKDNFDEMFNTYILQKQGK